MTSLARTTVFSIEFQICRIIAYQVANPRLWIELMKPGKRLAAICARCGLRSGTTISSWWARYVYMYESSRRATSNCIGTMAPDYVDNTTLLTVSRLVALHGLCYIRYPERSAAPSSSLIYGGEGSTLTCLSSGRPYVSLISRCDTQFSQDEFRN